MSWPNVVLLAFCTFLLAIALAPAPAAASPDLVETGRLLAILLDAGRVTVGANQPLINDASKGDKGFTPEVFEKQLIEKFKARSGVDLANLKAAKVPETAKTLLPELVAASKKTVADNQANINRKGVGFKGFTPAHFGTQAAAAFSAKTGIYLKQTTTDNLLRNPKNKADEFEAGLLKKFADPSYPRQGDKILSETVEGGKAVRVLLPLFYGKGCLGCHGEPKGETDISGYKKEGAKEGDLGGAISVKLPVK
ncbi:Tll0287-like domain-containing protein [Nitrospira sp. Kam-Ns4a]